MTPVVTATRGLVTATLQLLPGAEVTVDGSAGVRRTFSGVVVDPDGTLAPRVSTDLLAPYGTEITVATGFIYDDGTTETLPLGVFRLEESEPDGFGSIAIRGSDRSVVVAEARFETPYAIAAGTRLLTLLAGVVGGAIRDLINSRYPGLTYVATQASTATVPLTIYELGDRSGDPWSNALALAAGGGFEVFFDVLGRVFIRPVPTSTSDFLVWEYRPDEDSIIMESTNRLSSKDARNIAVVVGESPEINPPIRATAEVTDPLSPLYPAAFGRRPRFLVSPLITTAAQALAAAASLLRDLAGGSEQLTFTAVPHPAHEAGDVVRVVNDGLGLDVLVVLDRFSVAVDLGSPANHQTKARRTS